MIAVACLTLVVVLLLALLYLQQRAHADAESELATQHAAAQEAWTVERRELLTRIQAPQRIPVQAAENYVIPEREPDDWAKVGTVEIDPEYGLEDE